MGFEHGAETDEQKAEIEAAEYKLNDPASLFVTNSDAGCAQDLDALDVHLEDKHDHDEEHEHEHEHAEKEEESHDHADHEHEESTHKDVLMTYTFECASPDQLPQGSMIDLLNQFPNHDRC